MDKDYQKTLDRLHRYSIRKTHLGVGAVLIGVFSTGVIMSAPIAQAEEIPELPSQEETISQNESALVNEDIQVVSQSEESLEVAVASEAVVEEPIAVAAIADNVEVAEDQEIIIENDFIKQNITVENGNEVHP